MVTNPKKLGFYDEKELRDKVEGALREYYSKIETDTRELRLRDIKYGTGKYDPDNWGDIKSAILGHKTISAPIYGEFELRDKNTGNVIDSSRKKIGDLPLLTKYNSYIVKGSPYNIPIQLRLKPGPYSRETEVGENEVYSNVAHGKSFRTVLDPDSKKLTLRIGTTNIPLIPFLKEMGMGEGTIRSAVGTEVMDANAKDPGNVLANAYRALYNRKPEGLNDVDLREAIMDRFSVTELDTEVTKRNLGVGYSSVTPAYLRDTAKEVIALTRGEKGESNRDDISYKEIYTVMDHLPDIIRRNKKTNYANLNRLRRRMIDKNKIEEILDKPPSSEILEGYFTKSNLSRYANQVNPAAMTASPYITTLLGEGGISAAETVPSSSSDPQDTHFGFLDMLHTPESYSGGIVLNIATDTERDGKRLRTKVINIMNGREEKLSNDKVRDHVIAMPNEFEYRNNQWRAKADKVRALKNGIMSEVPAHEVRYMLKSPSGMFDTSANTIPFMANTQGNRILTASRMIEQAVALTDPDRPLVETAIEGRNVLDDIGRNYTVRSKVTGKVKDVKDDHVIVVDNKGKEYRYSMPRNLPLTNKAFIDAKVRVKPGDIVKPETILADTNFTIDGKMSLGKNLNVAYVPWYGKNYEDAVVLTESGANKLRSTHMFKEELKADPDTITYDINTYRAYSPKSILKDDLKRFDQDGVIKPGMEVAQGDMLVAALKRNIPRGVDRFVDLLRKSKARPFKDGALRWEYDKPGVVTDVVKKPEGVEVYIKTEEPMKVGDKLVGRYGNKGIVSEIIPDEIAPQFKDGTKIDVLVDPLSVVPRINLGQVLETAASKIAEKSGKPFVMENYDGTDYRSAIERMLKERKIPEKEDIYDPEHDRTIPNVFTGKQYYYKLMHQADLKATGRGVDGPYTQDMQPARGKPHGGQSIDRLTANVLLAHNARNYLRDALSIKNNMNDEYWDAIQHNRIPPAPKTPYEWEKFKGLMQGMGINTVQRGSELELTPLADQDVERLSAGRIKNPYRMILGKGIKATPDKDGLFGDDVGGIRGNVFNHIDLPTRIPSPAYRKAITTLLDIKDKDYENLLTE